jgi:hypothetical protein
VAPKTIKHSIVIEMAKVFRLVWTVEIFPPAMFTFPRLLMAVCEVGTLGEGRGGFFRIELLLWTYAYGCTCMPILIVTTNE